MYPFTQNIRFAYLFIWLYTLKRLLQIKRVAECFNISGHHLIKVVQNLGSFG